MTLLDQDAESGKRPGLLILFAPAAHPHRDAVCATLAWLAGSEGLLFECYYDDRPSGVHYGGGLPWRASPADLRGGTFAGGRHFEQFQLVVNRFDCQVACLGPTAFRQAIADAGLPVRASSADVAEFYKEVFKDSPTPWPHTLLVIGAGGDRLSLVPYACQEVAQRRLLALGGGDDQAITKLAPGMEVEELWAAGSEPSSIEDRTLAMAERWEGSTRTFFFGDPEAAGRWIPAAIRNGWSPVFGIPQADVIARLSKRLQHLPVVWGRQQDDSDFLQLSGAGVAFQLVDPGRPPFPVVSQAASSRVVLPRSPADPSDGELRVWARAGRVVGTIVFWAGMVRELECMYALSEILGATGLKAGVALTVPSFDYLDSTPLSMLSVAQEHGGLLGQLEAIVASAGAGGMIESAAPPLRFARTLAESSAALESRLGSAGMPRGWWGVMDAPLLPRRIRRVKLETSPPAIKLRYRRRSASEAAGEAEEDRRQDLRSRVRESPLAALFESIRPFDDKRPGGPILSILESVRAAGFEYALTKAEFGSPPTVVGGLGGLTVLNYTAGRWDGWTPFETINDLGDLVRAEKRLLKSRQPGWLLGGIDACLWTFSGHVWDRGRELRDMCRWLADGGSSGQVVNVTPRNAARYARILADEGLVRTVPAR